MSFVSNALQAAGASSAFWIILAVVLVVSTVGYLLTRRGGALAGSVAADNAKLIQDWIPTGRIDFAGASFEPADADTPASLYLQAEETRMLISQSGIEKKEIRWRQATLNEAKRVVNVFHRQLPRSPLRTLETDTAPSIASEGAVNPKPVVREENESTQPVNQGESVSRSNGSG
jgi:hypothetical protein